MGLNGVRSIFSQTLGMPAELCELARPLMGIIYFRRTGTLGDKKVRVSGVGFQVSGFRWQSTDIRSQMTDVSGQGQRADF